MRQGRWQEIGGGGRKQCVDEDLERATEGRVREGMERPGRNLEDWETEDRNAGRHCQTKNGVKRLRL